MSIVLHHLKIVCRSRHRSRTHYSDYDVPDGEDSEISALFSEPLQNDVVYEIPFMRDPYAAFDPDVSATSDDDNHEPAESGNAQQQQQQQRNFRKIGEQWGAMVTPHVTANHGISRRDGCSRYTEEKSAPRRDAFFRHDRYKDRRDRMRPADTRTPPGPSPDSCVHDQAVDTTPRVSRLVSEEVQTVAEDDRLSSHVVEVNGDVGIMCGGTGGANRDMVDSEVQCASSAPDLLKKEYIRLILFPDCSLCHFYAQKQLLL